MPKSLWERFDGACEKAYAPAARHFAEQAAQRKQARKQREEFIAAAAAHAPTLLAEPRDWRAIERWLRETDSMARRRSRQRRAGPGRISMRVPGRAAPLRDALAAARDKRRPGGEALIAEATALLRKRSTATRRRRSRQSRRRWQAQAKAIALLQRDERALWEQFRAACDAVFEARDAKRKQEDDQKHEGRRALEEICAHSSSSRRRPTRTTPRCAARCAIEEQWKQQVARVRSRRRAALDSRFTNAKAAVEAPWGARPRARGGGVANAGGEGTPV